jgi:hypothetical protein
MEKRRGQRLKGGENKTRKQRELWFICHLSYVLFRKPSLRSYSEYYARQMVLTCKRKHRQLTGEGTDKTCQMA